MTWNQLLSPLETLKAAHPKILNQLLSAHKEKEKGFVLKSGIERLDRFFGSSLRSQKIIEWGAPMGSYGRLLPLLFLAGKVPPIVWIYSHDDLKIYPPAWASWGIDLKNIFFVYAKDPIKTLRPLFQNNVFKIIVLDTPKRLHTREASFMANKIREQGQSVFLIRNYFLSPKRGNIFAHARFNVQYEVKKQGFHLHEVKGQNQDKNFIGLQELEYAG